MSVESVTDSINKHWFNKDYSISSFRKKGYQWQMPWRLLHQALQSSLMPSELNTNTELKDKYFYLLLFQLLKFSVA